MNRFKQILSTFIISMLCTVSMSLPAFASDAVYEFTDGSSEIWTEVDVIAIDNEYGITFLDFETLKEDKASAYAAADIDITASDVSILSIDEGELVDIGLDSVYLVQYSSSVSEYITLYETALSEGDIVYINDTEYEIQAVGDGFYEIAGIEEGSAVLNSMGQLVAVTVSDTEAVSSSAIYDAIQEYESEPETVPETEEETENTEDVVLDFSTLEELIAAALEYDSDELTDAIANARSVYLNAVTQEEIDAAVEELSAAIEAVEAEGTSSTNILTFAIIAIVIVLAIMFVISKMKKKPAKTVDEPDNGFASPNDFSDMGRQTLSAPQQSSSSAFQSLEPAMPVPASVETNNSDMTRSQDNSPAAQDYVRHTAVEEDDEPATSLLKTTLTPTLYCVRTEEQIPVTGAVFRIGRHSSCQYRPRNDAVSKKHCCIYIDKGKYYIEDNNSKNGTFVNGERVYTQALLKENAQIKLADEEFTFILPNGGGNTSC